MSDTIDVTCDHSECDTSTEVQADSVDVCDGCDEESWSLVAHIVDGVVTINEAHCPDHNIHKEMDELGRRIDELGDALESNTEQSGENLEQLREMTVSEGD